MKPGLLDRLLRREPPAPPAPVRPELFGPLAEPLNEIFAGRKEKLQVLIRMVDSLFVTDDERSSLRDLMVLPEMREFFERTRHMTTMRFELLYESVVALIYNNRAHYRPVIDLLRVAESVRFRRLSRVFYFPPVTPVFQVQIQNSVLLLAVEDAALASAVIETLLTDEFFLLRETFARAEAATTERLATGITRLALTGRSADQVRVFISTLVLESFQQFATLFEGTTDTDVSPTAVDYVTRYALKHDDTEAIRTVLSLFERGAFLRRVRKWDPPWTIARMWNLLCEMPETAADDLVPFLRTYAGGRGPVHRYTYLTTLRLHREHALSLMRFFNSESYRDFLSRYRYNERTALFLVKNAVRCHINAVPERFGGGVSGLMLQILLSQVLPGEKLRRRAEFFEWLAEHTASKRIEGVFLEYVFFDFIFFTLEAQVPRDKLGRVARYSGPGHRAFVEVLDERVGAYGSNLRNRDAVAAAHRRLLDDARSSVWQPYHEKFAAFEYALDTVRTIAESGEVEDVVLDALDELRPKHLRRYARHLATVWADSPEQIRQACKPTAFFALTFQEAHSAILEATLPLIGTVPVYPADWARTEGKAIYLPSKIDWFMDEPSELADNRNLAMYIYLALHECGHLLAGSFLIDSDGYAQTKQQPDTMRKLFNFTEDIRIERYLRQAEVYPQINELFDAAQRYFLADIGTDSIHWLFLGYLLDGLYFDFERYAADEEFREALDSTVLDAGLHSGPSPDVRAFADRIVTDLKSMEPTNPFAALRVADELYEVMVRWPAPVIYRDDVASVLDDISTAAEVEAEGATGTSGTSGSSGAAAGSTAGDAFDESEEAATSAHRGDGREARSETVDEETRGTGAGAHSASHMPTEEGTERTTVRSREELDELYEYANSHPREIARDPRELAKHPAIFEAISAEEVEEASSIIDDMRHTAADYAYGTNQQVSLDEKQREELRERLLKPFRDLLKGSGKKSAGKKDGSPGKPKKKQTVRSFDLRTGKRLKRSEIREFLVHETDRAFLNRHQRYRSVSRRIEMAIAAMMPQDAVLQERFNAFEGEFDMERTLEVIADFEHAGNHEVLLTEDEEHPRIRVVIGLDLSGSTAAPVDSGTGAEMVIDMEKHFALIFYDAVTALGGNIDVFGFNSYVGTNIYKPAKREAMSAFFPDAANRDGDFIRYVHEHLEQYPDEARFFFLISDGLPAAENYSGEEAVKDTAVAMREVVKDRIRLIYINTDPTNNPDYERFSAEATAAIRCTRPTDLPSLVPGLVQEVVKAVY